MSRYMLYRITDVDGTGYHVVDRFGGTLLEHERRGLVKILPEFPLEYLISSVSEMLARNFYGAEFVPNEQASDRSVWDLGGVIPTGKWVCPRCRFEVAPIAVIDCWMKCSRNPKRNPCPQKIGWADYCPCGYVPPQQTKTQKEIPRGN